MHGEDGKALEKQIPMQFCICGFQDHSGPALLLVIKALKKKLGVLAGSNNDVFGSVRVDPDSDPVATFFPNSLMATRKVRSMEAR